MVRVTVASLAAALFTAVGLRALPAEVPLRSIDRPGDFPMTSSAVVVEAGTPLVFTGQILPTDASGKVIGKGNPARQAGLVFERLRQALERAGSAMDRIVRVHLYAATPDALWRFRLDLAKRIEGRHRPALTSVIGPLPDPDALVALDVIAAGPAGARTRWSVGGPGGVTTATLGAGPKVFVSGQADPGRDLFEATKRTLEGLDASLAHVGTDRRQVVQIKAFYQPASGAADVAKAVAAHFGGDPAPPLVLVNWTSTPTLPVEIEVIASACDRPGRSGPLEFATPPALKPSPLFSRIATVGTGPLVFIGERFGPKGKGGREQVEGIFEGLKPLLGAAGSDFRHLVKATYYVADDAAGKALNDVRPKFFDPERPPTASKVTVSGVGETERTVSLDLIAVPSTGAASAR